MSDVAFPTLESATAQRFLLGLRLAAIVIATVLLCTLTLPNLVRNMANYHLVLVQLLCFAVYCGVVAVGAAVVLRNKPWGRLRWVALGVIVAATLASELDLRHGFAMTGADWAFGCVGWLGVIVLTERPLIELVGFLAVQEVAFVANALLTRPMDRTASLLAATTSMGSIGFPLSGAIAVTALRFIANAAEDAAHKSGQVRAAEAVAAGLHERRRQRFASLYDTAAPLLQGLADGTLDAEDDQVQRRCAIEAARMRRLFAEIDEAPNPLLHALRHCADVADRKGIVVEMEGKGQWPEPPLQIRRALTEAPLAALATARSWARVTVVGTSDLLSVNVVADCGAVDLPLPAIDEVRLQTVSEKNVLWVEVRWATGPPSR